MSSVVELMALVISVMSRTCEVVGDAGAGRVVGRPERAVDLVDGDGDFLGTAGVGRIESTVGEADGLGQVLQLVGRRGGVEVSELVLEVTLG